MVDCAAWQQPYPCRLSLALVGCICPGGATIWTSVIPATFPFRFVTRDNVSKRLASKPSDDPTPYPLADLACLGTPNSMLSGSRRLRRVSCIP